ncbi:hypothetical protein [Roseateles amylovorans]|uniref:Uncharacterized protein n=1 Tax=Roseateles amylovorans TaxID=2978473 RepID=A0ABY6B4S0_9BURK|nr:hypothetical protein [Roseateles amylovorans]UXH80185.1 hypothetical protein N4261_10020 [Roseateles amylovorans]
MAAAATAVTHRAITPTFRCFMGHPPSRSEVRCRAETAGSRRTVHAAIRVPDDFSGARGERAVASSGAMVRLACRCGCSLRGARSGTSVGRGQLIGMNYAQAVAGSLRVSDRMSRPVVDDPSMSLFPVATPDRPPSPASALPLLREWSQQFSEPGAWSADAWRAVGLAILAMPDWPGPSLDIEVGGHHHVYVRPGESTECIRLVQGRDHRHWSVHHEGAATPLARPGGDAFFEALVEGLNESPVPREAVRSPRYWRERVARTLSDGVAHWPAAAGPARWLDELLQPLPQPLERAVAAVAAQTATPAWADVVRRQAVDRPSRQDGIFARRFWPAEQVIDPPPPPLVNGDRSADPCCNLPLNDHPNFLDEPEIAEALYQTRAELDRFRLHDACCVVEAIEPSFKTPMILMIEICGLAVQNDETHRAARMLERLAQGPSPMFTPLLGYDPAVNTLDFHYAKLLRLETVPAWARPERQAGPWSRQEQQAVLQSFYQNGAASAALAEVLFELHRSRGRLGPGSHLVVGEHGTGKLRRTMVRCLQGCGWGWQPALYLSKASEMRGRIVIAPPDGSLTVQQRWTRSFRYDVAEFEQALAAAAAAGHAEVAMSDQRVLLQVQTEAYFHFGMSQMLKMFNAQARLPPLLYTRLFLSAVKLDHVDLLMQPVQAMLQRYRPLSAATWEVLLSDASKGRTPHWRKCEQVVAFMQREGVTLSDRMAVLILQSASQRWHIDKVAKMTAASEGAARSPRSFLRQAFLKAACAVGDQDRWDVELARLGGRNQPAFQAIRDHEVLLLSQVRSIDDGMALHDRLRAAGVRFSRKVMVKLLPLVWAHKRWKVAAKMIRASIRGEDGIYVPTLGWEPSQDRDSLRLDRFGLLKNEARTEAIPALTLTECMSIVALHWLSGRLTIGTLLSLGEGSTAVSEPATRPHLATMGLMLKPFEPRHDGIVSVWQVAPLRTDDPR